MSDQQVALTRMTALQRLSGGAVDDDRLAAARMRPATIPRRPPWVRTPPTPGRPDLGKTRTAPWAPAPSQVVPRTAAGLR